MIYMPTWIFWSLMTSMALQAVSQLMPQYVAIHRANGDKIVVANLLAWVGFIMAVALLISSAYILMH